MSPQIAETKLPTGYTLAPRDVSRPVDDRPLLRDREGRVLAWVERWTPDGIN